MKRIIPVIFACAAAMAFITTGCGDTDENAYDLSLYTAWRAENDAWLKEMQARKNADGTPYYTTVIPAWNPQAFVLMHFYNDRSLTAGNLVPLYNSTVDVRYNAYTCDGERFDSSTLINSYGKLGIARFECNNTIQGWSIAMEQMHVGDTAEVIIPYNVGYGTQLSASLKPFSNLRFQIRLEDIYAYERN